MKYKQMMMNYCYDDGKEEEDDDDDAEPEGYVKEEK